MSRIRKSKLIMSTRYLHQLDQQLRHKWSMFSQLLRQHLLVQAWYYQISVELIEKLVCHMVNSRPQMQSRVLMLIEPLIHSRVRLAEILPSILMALSPRLSINRWVWIIKFSLTQELVLIIHKEVRCTQGLRLQLT